MSALTPHTELSPLDVERASERDGKIYELIEGKLQEKRVDLKARFIATLICGRLNSVFYPPTGFAVVGGMIYCFGRSDHGRAPDVAYVRLARLPGKQIPKGDLHMAPDLVVEVPAAGHVEIDSKGKVAEYLAAGVSMVWIVNPDRRTIRIYRNDGTTRLFRAQDVIENEPRLPGFRLLVGDVFPA